MTKEEAKAADDRIIEWKKDFKEYVNSLSMPRDDYNGIIEYIDEFPRVEQTDGVISELEKITEGINKIKGGNKYAISDYMCGMYKAFDIVDGMITDRVAELKEAEGENKQ